MGLTSKGRGGKEEKKRIERGKQKK